MGDIANDTLRIAVRKFGPFETALQKLWDAYCAETGCKLKAKMVPMDLDDLHSTILGKEGLKNGKWDIAHVVTDWLVEAVENDSLEDLQPYINQNRPDGFPGGYFRPDVFLPPQRALAALRAMARRWS